MGSTIFVNMLNPWKDLPNEAPFVLDSDREDIVQYNQKVKLEYRINLTTPPDPYIGDVFHAKIVLLQLNPGSDFSPGFLEPNESLEQSIFSEVRKDNVKNILHEYGEFPFYHLDPKYRITGGFRYWSQLFSKIIKHEEDYARIAENICCIEFFPYHSKNFKPLNKTVESQKYSFYLLREAIERGAIILLLRGEREWRGAVKELATSRYFKPRSTRNPIISKRNFSQEQFEEIVAALSV